MPITFHVPDSALGGIDEYTKLMLHMDGADDGTSFIDSSLSPYTVTRVNALTKTGIKKFGTASGYFDGSGDYLSIPDSDDWNFGASDMTIDFWVNFSDITGQKFLFNQRADGTHAHELSLNSGSLKWAAYNGGTVFDFSRSVTLSTGTWYHIAAVRNGNVLRLYLDGQQQGADQAFTGTMPDLGAAFDIGRWSGDGIYLNGYIDELRISKGIARWTSNFTPENGPYTT